MKRGGTKVEDGPTAAGWGSSYTGAGEQAWQGYPFGRQALVGKIKAASCLWRVTLNQHLSSNSHCLSHTISVAIMARQKCSPIPCYADNNGHITTREWRPVSVKRLLDGVWENYEKTFQLGFTFMWFCQLWVILHTVPSTEWSASRKGRIAYLLSQTIWMWESACFMAVHADCFAFILH